MCCRSTVAPLPEGWEWIMGIAGFKQGKIEWIRHVGESTVVANLDAIGQLHFKLTPSIGAHSPNDHLVNAPAAAVMFETMRALAERSNGTIQQLSLVGMCLLDNGLQFRVLAEYPEKPLLFDRLCSGFQAVFLRGVPQERTE